jgi:hypothetical protein
MGKGTLFSKTAFAWSTKHHFLALTSDDEPRPSLFK